jgi:hypothetical protein
MRLYKYFNNKWVDSLLEGRLWINTLHNIQNEEIEGDQIGDKDEGTLITDMEGQTMNMLRPDSIAMSMFRFKNVKMGNGDWNVGTVLEKTKNCYLYCTSVSLDIKITEEINKTRKIDEIYDTCVRIKDHKKFFKLINESLVRSKKAYQIAEVTPCEVVYRERESAHSLQTNIHPAFVKPLKFKYQKEFRNIWGAEGSDPEPFELHCPEIRDLVEKWNFPE